MPKVTVDDQEIEVPQGATVLQACELAGKDITSCRTTWSCNTSVGGTSMRKAGWIGLVLVAVTVVAKPASGQIAPGQSGQSSMRYFEGQETWDALGEFGTCYASLNRKAALELVSTRGGSAEEVATYKRLFRAQNQSCLGDISQLRVDWPLVRGAVAEGLYRKSIPVPAALAVATPPTTDAVRNMGDAALCYTSAHREAAKALVATRVGSKAEDKAVSAMLPQLARCIPSTAKRSLQMDTTLIRFRVAEALWKLGLSPDGRARAGSR